MEMAIIAAVAHHRVIGYKNGIPWHIISDLSYFKSMTMNGTVIVGRKTLQTLPNLLSRNLICITRHPKLYIGDMHTVTFATSVHDAIDLAKKAGKKVFVAGGEQIYTQFLPLVDIMHITEVNMTVTGDTFFPGFNIDDWEVNYGKMHENRLYRHIRYCRKK